MRLEHKAQHVEYQQHMNIQHIDNVLICLNCKVNNKDKGAPYPPDQTGWVLL